MAIQIPSNGFEVQLGSNIRKAIKQFRRNFRHQKRIIDRLDDVLKRLPTNILDDDLNFHKVYKDKEFKGYSKKATYFYAITIVGLYRFVFYFDDGKVNPEENPPNFITLIYIGNYH